MRKENKYQLQRVKLFMNAREEFKALDNKNLKPEDPETTGHPSRYVKLYRKTDESGKVYTVFGIKNKDQDKVDFVELRSFLAKEMGHSSNTNFIQFIGDSALYSEKGTDMGAKCIAQELENEGKNSIILYGYTGSKNKELGRPQRDVNQLLSDWIDQETEANERSKRVIANIVDEHTITAIQSWGCSISENVNHFFLVYSSSLNPSTKFGDDVKSSDGITNRKAIALEGGIQTLRQIIYMISRGVKIQGISNLRDYSNPNDVRYFDPVTKLPYLSAIEFLAHMKNKISQFTGEITKPVLNKMAHDYLLTHALYNKNKGDAGTKEELWNLAWKQFVTQGWGNLGLLHYEIIPEFKPEIIPVKLARMDESPAIKNLSDNQHNLFSQLKLQVGEQNNGEYKIRTAELK